MQEWNLWILRYLEGRGGKFGVSLGRGVTAGFPHYYSFTYSFVYEWFCAFSTSNFILQSSDKIICPKFHTI